MCKFATRRFELKARKDRNITIKTYLIITKTTKSNNNGYCATKLKYYTQ